MRLTLDFIGSNALFNGSGGWIRTSDQLINSQLSNPVFIGDYDYLVANGGLPLPIHPDYGIIAAFKAQ